MTHRTLATEMPAAGEALSAYSLEHQRVRRRPGAQPRIYVHRPQGRKQNQKQNRRVAPRQAPYFFQARKKDAKTLFLFLARQPVPLFNAAAKQAGIFFVAAEKASFPGSLRSHGPNGSEVPRRKRLFDTGTSPLRLRQCIPAHRAACRSLGSFFCRPGAPTQPGRSEPCLDPPNPRNSNARRRRKALFCVLFWASKRGRRRPGAQPRTNLIRPKDAKSV
ncbi:hypothetical protein EDC39_11569 [Geothermobacter ehrlichii]|uniref:Uncharacterized protein n=1 Tax=Geothermobacter ehrlichii TaxID=213224 RepID=A0A5D3WF60_9BACT|nr:hypothetical protein EDC39_11569 [Geothermobacter ehrlichii]